MSSPEKDFPASETPFAMDQEPTVMPGFTAPVTDPWPPLSREQVVELHEALIEFLKSPMLAPNRLAMKLFSLGIGTPPKTKRWSEDQLQQAVEEVQSFQDAQSAADGLLARAGLPPVRKNCWTCRHNTEQETCDISDTTATLSPTDRWIMDHVAAHESMPVHTADGCPGWEQKP